MSGLELTLRLETRSAVSRRVNWLIWSTMEVTLGFVDAGVVDSHRRDDGGALRWRCGGISEAGRRRQGRDEGRRDRAQQRAVVDVQDRDMVEDCEKCRGLKLFGVLEHFDFFTSFH